MSSLDDVWARMKQKASEYAGGGVIPEYAQAKSVVTSLLYAARLDPRPNAEVIDFYTRELIALTRDEIDKDLV